MNAATIFHRPLGLFIFPLLVAALLLTPQRVQSQNSPDARPAEFYQREELAQMLAPIALYPDTLLSQILMASTYPIEVIEAERWIRTQPGLQDDALDRALLDKNWEPSVKAMVHFPSILALMSERITETTELGNAFLAQETEVLAMVQELRAQAHAQGHLNSTTQQRVLIEKETIIIAPADPRIIYVPYYDPFYVYGGWWYPAYPPYYWAPHGVSIGYGISYWPGFYFRFAFGGWSYFDWHRHTIYINVQQRPRYVRQDRWPERTVYWQHAPSHRRGVAYRDHATARKYGQPLPRTRSVAPDNRGLSHQRPQDRPQRGNDRPVMESNRREAEGTRGARQERQRLERPVMEAAPPERVRQERQRQGGNSEQQQPIRERQQQAEPQKEATAQAGERQPGGQDQANINARGERPTSTRTFRKDLRDYSRDRGRAGNDEDRGRGRR
jgi:hypothetical protein